MRKIFVADHLRETHIRHRGLERATRGMDAVAAAAYLDRIGASANIPAGSGRRAALRRAGASEIVANKNPNRRKS